MGVLWALWGCVLFVGGFAGYMVRRGQEKRWKKQANEKL